MSRFLLFALPLLVLAMALFDFALEMLGVTPGASLLTRLAGSRAAPTTLPAWAVLATWLLEAVALTALFLLVQARGGVRWLSGLLAGWIAWVFRGPLLVVTVAGAAGLPAGPWWSMALSWWVLYSLCGLLLGGLASLSGVEP